MEIYCNILLYCHILPYIALYCYTYIAIYVPILVYIVTAPSPAARIDYCHSPALFSKLLNPILCHHSFFVVLRKKPICPLFAPIVSSSNLFHIIFTGSFYVSLYIIFTKNKASILIRQLNVVCMRFLNILLEP